VRKVDDAQNAKRYIDPGGHDKKDHRKSQAVQKINHIFSAAGNAYFDNTEKSKEDDEHFILTLESQGQLDEYEILKKIVCNN
jgi:hypothetical protein